MHVLCLSIAPAIIFRSHNAVFQCHGLAQKRGYGQAPWVAVVRRIDAHRANLSPALLQHQSTLSHVLHKIAATCCRQPCCNVSRDAVTLHAGAVVGSTAPHSACNNMTCYSTTRTALAHAARAAKGHHSFAVRGLEVAIMQGEAMSNRPDTLCAHKRCPTAPAGAAHMQAL